MNKPFCGDVLKDLVYVPPLPRDINDIMIRIRELIQTFDWDTMNRTWDELLYCLDVISVTNGVHIKHLWNGKRGFFSFFVF
jgi:hypothetical protein